MKFVKKAGMIAIAAVLCFAVGMAAGVRTHRQEASQISADLISSRIEEISQLSSVEYHYTRVGKYEDRLDFYGWQVPLTMKRFIISYDGVICAGVDLRQAKIEVTENSIEITLPQAKILSHEQDLDSITVFDETKNIFNPIQITDYIAFSKEQKQGAEEEAIEKGLLAEAQKRAAQTLEEWLLALSGGGDDAPQIRVVSAQ